MNINLPDYHNITPDLYSYFYENASQNILHNLLTGHLDFQDVRLQKHTLEELLPYHEDCYQVILYEPYHRNAALPAYDFSEMLRISAGRKEKFDVLTIDGNKIILLRGQNVIRHFAAILAKYDSSLPPQNNSPLDNYFLACGRIVDNLALLPTSYQDTLQMIARRFFCSRGQHCLRYESFFFPSENASVFSDEKLNRHIEQQIAHFVILIQTYNYDRLNKLLSELEDNICDFPLSALQAKSYLLDFYTGIKEKIGEYYKEYDIPFLTNSSIVQFIQRSNHCYQVIDFLKEQFEAVMNATGHFSRDSIIDIVINYVEHNYAENITLDNISPIFGYNSSYLGKIFSQKTGQKFHTYLDDVRIEKSKQLLTESRLPVYRIAVKVGYKNVDYFHVKFKNKMGISPAGYRKQKEDVSS